MHVPKGAKYICLNDKFHHRRIDNNLGIKKNAYKVPNREVIREKEYIKDLGVYISSDLTWTRQTKKVVSNARFMFGWTRRTFHTRKEIPMITIWNQLINPCLDYCSLL